MDCQTNHSKVINIGIESHNLISDHVSWLMSLLVDSAPRGKPLYCANIMYNVPRLAGTFHLAPIIHPELPALTGISSPYFKKVKSLCALFPTQADIEALVKFGIRSPIARSSAHDLLLQYNSDGSELPLLPLRRGLLKPTKDEDILYGLLGTFSNPDKHLDIIKEFWANGLSSGAIQCLLGFLPQFNETTEAVMTRTEGESSGHVVAGIRWVSQEEKIKLWEEHAKNDKPRDRAFWLLSAVESLQWSGFSEFGIVDSLYSFLISKDCDEIGLRKIKDVENDTQLDAYLGRLWLLLKQITFYFNIKDLEEDKKRADLACKLQTKLRTEVANLASLAATVGMWHMQQINANPSNNDDGRIAKVAQALLNIADPLYVTCKDKFTGNSITRARVDLDSLDIYKDDDAEPGEMFSQLNQPWGIYEDIEKPEIEVGSPVRLSIQNCGDIELGFGEEGNDLSKAFDRSRLELGRYLHDAVTRMQNLDSDRIRSEVDVEDDWYKSAFDEYYIAFDKNRQNDPAIAEFSLRKREEDHFYQELLLAETKELDRTPVVLDIGIGYGRLAQKLIDKKLISAEDYHGLDLSHTMLSACGELLPKIPLYEGSMHELKALLKKFGLEPDVFIWAYSTFGCYRNDTDLETLRGLADVVKPYGLVVIEQHNPRKANNEKYILEHGPLEIDGKEVKLYKTTSLVCEGEDCDWADYTGQYNYYEVSPTSYNTLLRKISYCVRIYTDNWLKRVLKEMDFHVEFFADFDPNKPYNVHRTDATVMICVATKLPVKLADLVDAIKKVRDIYLGMKDRFAVTSWEEPLRKFNIENIQPTETVLRDVVKNRPTAEEVETIRKADLNVKHKDNYIKIINKWFKK